MIWLGLEGCSFQAGSMVLISDEEKRRSGAPPRRARRPGSAGPRLGGGASRCSSWDRSLHKEDWKHGSIGKLDPKEGGIGYGRKRDYRDGTQPPLSNSFLSGDIKGVMAALANWPMGPELQRGVLKSLSSSFSSFS